MTDATFARALQQFIPTAQATIWLQSSIAFLVLLVAWWAHSQAKPYEWHYQNVVEGWLFGANTTMIVLATVYTALGMVVSQASSLARRAIEALMLALLVIAFVASACWMIYNYKNGMRTQREVENARRMMLASGPAVRIEPPRLV